MRLLQLISAALILFVSAPAFAQEWFEYVDRKEYFQINFRPACRTGHHLRGRGRRDPSGPRLYRKGRPGYLYHHRRHYKDSETVAGGGGGIVDQRLGRYGISSSAAASLPTSLTLKPTALQESSSKSRTQIRLAAISGFILT